MVNSMNTRIRKIVIGYFLSTIAVAVQPCAASDLFYDSEPDVRVDAGIYDSEDTAKFFAFSSSLTWAIAENRLLGLETGLRFPSGRLEMTLKAGVISAASADAPLRLDETDSSVTLLGIRIDF